jgi:hypothetical protein
MAHLSSGEFQDNTDMAFVIRMTLAQNALVKQGSAVSEVSIWNDQVGSRGRERLFSIEFQDGSNPVYADRVLDARGLGTQVQVAGPDNTFFTDERVMNFVEFMRRMDSPFPLQGMKRVAVLGSGDSARCAVEALLGMGPAGHRSVAALDFVEQIDWFGASLPASCEGWRNSERGRYQSLGSALTPLQNGAPRLRIIQQRGFPLPGPDSVNVGGRFYDHVITAAGWFRDYLGDQFDDMNQYPTYTSQALGRQSASGYQLYKIGPIADLEFDGFESVSQVATRSENKVALFRYGWRTAALAQSLS